MDQKLYYDTVDRMQKAGVDPEYIQGWVGGFMGNPKTRGAAYHRSLRGGVRGR